MKKKEEKFEIQIRETRDLVRRMDRQIELVERLLAESEQPRELLIEKYRVGEYELQRADYLFVCWLAEGSNLTPEEVMDRPIVVELESDGQFRALAIDQFDISKFDLPMQLPNLKWLWCNHSNLARLELTAVPNLEWLHCTHNNLTELNVTAVPDLVWLNCCDNCLTELDVTALANLESLSCGNNSLTELDVRSAPKLESLFCCDNCLTELDLTAAPNLVSLSCSNNNLTELDLTSVRNLEWLCCFGNSLTELNISPIKNLKELIFDKSSTRLIKRPDQNF